MIEILWWAIIVTLTVIVLLILHARDWKAKFRLLEDTRFGENQRATVQIGELEKTIAQLLEERQAWIDENDEFKAKCLELQAQVASRKYHLVRKRCLQVGVENAGAPVPPCKGAHLIYVAVVESMGGEFFQYWEVPKEFKPPKEPVRL